MEMIDVLKILQEIAETKPDLVKDAVDNVERTNPKVDEGAMKDYLHSEAEKLSREVLTLPIYPNLKDSELKIIFNKLNFTWTLINIKEITPPIKAPKIPIIPPCNIKIFLILVN